MAILGTSVIGVGDSVEDVIENTIQGVTFRNNVAYKNTTNDQGVH